MIGLHQNKIVLHRSLIAFLFSILLSVSLLGQKPVYIISKEFNNTHWEDFITNIEEKYTIRFFYNPEDIPDFLVKINTDTSSLLNILRENLKQFDLNVAHKSGNIFITSESSIQTSLPNGFFKIPSEESKEEISIGEKAEGKNFLTTNKDFIQKVVTVGTKKEGLDIDKTTVSGLVKSADDGTAIANGTLYIEELEKGTTTDEKGSYSIILEKGKYTLIVNSLESEETKYKMEVLSSGQLDIFLEPKLYLLDEFVVSSDKEHNVRGSQMGFEKLTTKKIKEIPVVLGERDIIKVALLLPGVQTVGEGATGFNVRGSPADQNLFYINGVPVYNTSHLFGFFSSFNSDAVSDFSLLKSSIPVKYGGRLSSIFDIHTKQGNKNKFSARGGISPITGKIMVEGPIVKDKASYLLSLRSTYSDWILKFVEDQNIRKSSAYFGDGIANVTINGNKNNQFNVFAYFSYDDANIASLTKYKYSNTGGSLSWHHNFRNKHSFDLTLTSGKYEFNDQNMEYDLVAYKQSYELNHSEVRLNFTLNPSDKHSINLGINSTLYDVNRGDFLPLNEKSNVTPKSFEPEKGVESGIYLGDRWSISENFELSGGLRFNLYNYLGPKTVYKYLEGAPKKVENIIDTLVFKGNSIIKTYNGIDFRLAAKYLINENLSVKGSYNRLHQYLFLLSNTIAISPTDNWKLSDYHIEPMVGDQYSLGIYSNFLGNYFEVSLEGYYKDVKNLVELKDGADLIGAELPETNIIQGELDAYGIELMIRKPYGRFNGWVNYTYSRSTVLANNQLTGEQNNFGISYPANYDKPHAFNLVGNYRISKRLSFSGNLVYSTGRPITYPTAVYYQNEMEITHYSLRNEYRLPDYFRVDVSINLEGNLKKRKFLHGSWALSVYNVTGRRNAYSVYFKSEGGVIKGYKLSIFGAPIFSISYNFKLGNYED